MQRGVKWNNFYKTLTSIYCCMQSKCIVNLKVNSKVQSIIYQIVGILSLSCNPASSLIPIMDMKQDCFNVLCHGLIKQSNSNFVCDPEKGRVS